ncbi:uncharacterized protein DMAD_09715 [Drosophila madeirensis]|uniref:Uncharacterized protein n=1 Tax=Drosophila madeirensis TaxID=30013 RepID=A0AAU9F8C6_DROMD
MPLAKNVTRDDNVEVNAECRASGRACTDDDQCCTNICLHFRRCSPQTALLQQMDAGLVPIESK